jgi:hypothetical protein
MNRSALCCIALATSLGACGDDGGGGGTNPDRLYLALLRTELMVQLVGEEPDPY